jgi:predicted acetyltransferase
MKFLLLFATLATGFNIYAFAQNEYLPKVQILDTVDKVSDGDGYNEKKYIINIKKQDGSIEPFKVASDVLIKPSDRLSEYTDFKDLVETDTCIAIQTNGVRIPSLSYRSIKSFEETFCNS